MATIVVEVVVITTVVVVVTALRHGDACREIACVEDKQKTKQKLQKEKKKKQNKRHQKQKASPKLNTPSRCTYKVRKTQSADGVGNLWCRFERA